MLLTKPSFLYGPAIRKPIGKRVVVICSSLSFFLVSTLPDDRHALFEDLINKHLPIVGEVTSVMTTKEEKNPGLYEVVKKKTT